ncbi:MAG: DUF1080 domain-containing protein [Reichenbachiella sp.]
MSSCEPENTEQESWQQLFNGKDLKGWSIKFSGHEIGDNYKNTFVVEDSILKVNYSEYDSFNNKYAHLYYEKPFSHYRLKIEYRFVGVPVPGAPSWCDWNSGVMLHSQSAQEQQLNQNFPVSIEMQFLGKVEGESRTNGNLASPGTHVLAYDSLYKNHMLYSNYSAPEGDEWINIEAVVLGDSIVHHIVEGDTVLTYSSPRVGGWEKNSERWVEDNSWMIENEGMPLKKGYIALQAESHAIHFRKVELLDLSDQYK